MKQDPDYHSPNSDAATDAAEDGRTCTTCATEGNCVAADAPPDEAPSSSSSCNSSRELLERVFQLIQEGNAAKERSRNYWLAADKYLQVYDVLQQLIQKMNDNNNNNSHNNVVSRNGDDTNKIAINNNNNNSSHEEQEEETIELQPQLDSDFYKIRQLYYDQSIDYRHQIRQCFIRALQQGDEDANDDGNRITTLTTADTTTTTTTTAITATAATSHEYRCNLLHRFYHNCHNQDHLVSHPQPYISPVMDTKDRPTWNHTDAAIHHIHDVTATVVVQPGEPTLTSRPPNHHKDVTVTTTEDDAHNDDIDDAQQSMILQTLEQRLQQLRTSLPSYVKSESQLLQERNAQLQRLGIYTNTTTTSSSNNNNGDNTSRTNDAWAMHATPQQHHLLLPPAGTTVSNNQENDAVDAILAQVQEEIAMTLPKPMNHHPTDHVPTLDDQDRTTTTEQDQYLLHYHPETTSSQSHASTTSSSSDHDSEDDEALIHDLLTNDNV
jgi:hypothetical protein